MFENVRRMVVLGDTHGTAGPTIELLRKLRLLDEERHWTGGETHLVFNGDVVDRGDDDRALLDLIRSIQPEALAAGGRVHMTLGNHEAMNLLRDQRYVTRDAYLAFADREDPADRERARGRYLRNMRETGMTEDQLHRAFDLAHPPGYYGRLREFGPEGEYAAWLLRQAVALRIDDTLVVHAGLTEETAGLGLDGLNRAVKEDIEKFWEARKVLEESDEVEEWATLQEVMRAAREIDSQKGMLRIPEIRQAAADLMDMFESPAVASDGPLWYRGNAQENERVEGTRMELVLEMLGAERMVVGHTITRSGRITSRFDGRLVKADTGLYVNENPQAVVVDGGSCRVFDGGTGRYLSTMMEAPQGEAATLPVTTFPDPYLERYLERAKVRETRPLGRGSTRPLLLDLDDGGKKMRGLFKYVQEPPEDRSANGAQCIVRDRWQHEIAAYRLDRLIGLNLVPVTVGRWFGSKGRGSIQRWIDAAMDHRNAQIRIPGKKYHEGLFDTWERMRVFDALIGNPDRKDSDILHLPRKKVILLVDHSKAFSPTPELDPFLLGSCELDGEMERALRSLDVKELKKELGQLLSRKQIDAVLKRRDLLLEACSLKRNDVSLLGAGERRSGGRESSSRLLPALP